MTTHRRVKVEKKVNIIQIGSINVNKKLNPNGEILIQIILFCIYGKIFGCRFIDGNILRPMVGGVYKMRNLFQKLSKWFAIYFKIR